ncbi:DUF4926 domain-containing protein [Psychrobacter sp. NZS113]|uniref:DUF4926 domain-containing protein n=1 Tax=Psychrobacter sp. NZS113 TaxID=2792045 RepID=UPI0018CF6999|nr:DUF4926 domain-containing protein [Psychrobacter sp. NZS113]MBH0096591.1 DUF4926 domain-containing protein [Psychrobacter sp. NZS113]
MLNINDVIKVSKDIQDNIRAGHLGTVVHIFDVTPPVYEIEFTDNEGRTLATVPLKKEDMSLYWVASTETYFK